MNKLFENVDGNRFKLISESIEEQEPKSSLVRKGLKKVFSEGEKEYSYKRLEGVGLGYIRNVSEAKKCALQEARELALEFGYKDNEEEAKFIKEFGPHPDPNLPCNKNKSKEEFRELQIGQKILQLSEEAISNVQNIKLVSKNLDLIDQLAEELIALHTGKAVTKPGTGGMSYKPGSIY
jgi:hypothetical protein